MNYFKFFTEIWRFFKKYYNRPGKEQDYAESVHECSLLAKSFGNGDFVDRVCIAVLDELERCWRGREEAQNGNHWKYRVLRGDHLCGGVAAEQARAAERSAGGRGADGISYRMEP